jgi:two-component system phosphate regulon sensor histidine kinase PhoR
MALRHLARGETDPACARLNAVVEQTDRLTEMIETFQDAARVGAERIRLRLERLDLRSLAEEATERARNIGGRRSDRPVEISIPDGCVGMWDRSRVVRALRALISNAFLYGDAQVPVRVEGSRNSRFARVAVSGGGPGPNADEERHLFERFYRGPSAAEAGHSGSGLGLYTARGIARVHGGDLRRVEGDTFELELPLE